jgi:hypothetical protein
MKCPGVHCPDCGNGPSLGAIIVLCILAMAYGARRQIESDLIHAMELMFITAVCLMATSAVVILCVVRHRQIGRITVTRTLPAYAPDTALKARQARAIAPRYVISGTVAEDATEEITQ